MAHALAPGGMEVLRELRWARRRRAYGDIDWSDALYRVYVTALFAAVGGSMVSGWVGGDPVAPPAMSRVLAQGPAVVGLAVAAAVAVGLRSGGRGGPLVLQRADVAHVLLAPIPRGAALRGPAFRQLRFTAFAGAVAGMAAGNLAAQRLPGTYSWWVASGGAAGLVTGLSFTGAALVASGLRAGRRVASVAAAGVLAWSVADVVNRSATSPATFLGRLAMAPLDGLPAPAIGAVLLALPLAGMAVVGGTSLDAAQRQAGLLAQLRFAVTMQDVRTVILLRRQLAAEGPRRRPWVRVTGLRRRGNPVWLRDCQGALRWPAVRVLRVALLGAAAGAALAGARRGTPALVLVAAGALLVAALDAVEGLAQEADHPVLSGTFPVAAGRLTLRHLAVPAVVMLAVAAVGSLTAAAIGPGDPWAVLAIGAVLAVPAALGAVGGAALSVGTGPSDTLQLELFAGAKATARALAPPVVIVLGVLPALHAQALADAGGSAVAGAVSDALTAVIVAAGVAVWLSRR